MKLIKESAAIFVPDGQSTDEALERTTHIAIGAHQDDLEIMAIDGILKSFQNKEHWFTGVIVTNGAGSAREGFYEKYTDEEMRQVRVKEQYKAAYIGEYAAQFLLDYSSAEVKDSSNQGPVDDLTAIFKATQPKIVYTHNLADKHPTHIAVALRTIAALRSLPEDLRPKSVYGCEIWRNLDWMLDEDKVIFNCSSNENLQTSLVGIFDSQISGGKRYDLATMGRRIGNATYYAPHDVDFATGMVLGMDLTPLIQDQQLDIGAYVQSYIDRFANDVSDLINNLQ